MADSIASQENLVLRLIQAYDARRTTEILRDLAVEVTKLRSLHDHDGGPDWGGKSWDYRQSMSSIYEQSRVSTESLQAVKNGLRYHVGNHLRDTLSPRDLEAAGLRTASPKDRIGGARSELLTRARDAGMGGPNTLPEALERIESALHSAAVQARGARPSEHAEARLVLKRIASALREVKSATAK